MEQQQDSAVKQWHYEEGGERKGPVTEEEIKHLIDNRKIVYGSLIWKRGTSGWIKVDDSGFRDYLQLNQVPPLDGSKVDDKVVWVLAFAPVIGFMLSCMLSGAAHNGSIEHASDYWYITLLLNIGLAYFDENRLSKAGHDTSKFKGMVWLVPVYLFQRAKNLNQGNSYFIVWIVCFVLSLLG